MILTFLVSGNQIFDLSLDQVSDSIELCFNYEWSIQPTPSILPSDATYTVEVSNDNVKFDAFRNSSIDVNVDNPGFSRTMSFRYIRVTTKSNGSLGNCGFKINLKN